MELKSSQVRHRFVLFPALVARGQETEVLHHYMEVSFRGGKAFVLDFAGYQFGFNKVLYTLSEFKATVLRGSCRMWPVSN